MYTQRNHIVQSFYDSEVVYHKYLKSLHKQYSHYMALAQTKEKAGVQSYRFLDETFEFWNVRALKRSNFKTSSNSGEICRTKISKTSM